MRLTGRFRAALLGAAFLAPGCQHPPVADPLAARPSFELRVRLPPLGRARYRSLSLWVARPLGESREPLVMHVTGDSGRHGLDLLLFTAVTRWGYPVALVPSPNWAETWADGRASPQALARDLSFLSRVAARAAGLPEAQRIILLGQSRGAGLSIEAASEPPLRDRLYGVVALGLSDVEEFVVRGGSWARPYRDKALLDGLRLEVIQSTHDRFLSAAAARAAFGPDTERQRLHAVEARSHIFAGSLDALLDELRSAIARVSDE